MPDNNKQYYVYVPGEAQGRIVDAASFDAGKDKLFSTYPDASVTEISNYNPEDTDFRDGDKYQVLVPGMATPTTIDSKAFNARKDDFFKQYPEAQVQKVRDYSQDYWQPKLDEAQAALDSFDKENGEFMLKYEEDLRSEDLKQRGWGGDLNDVQRNVTENREKYFGLAKQRKALLDAKFSNPLINKERGAKYNEAIAGREEALKMAEQAETGAERRDWKRAAKLFGDTAELYIAPKEYGKGEVENGFKQYLDDFGKGAMNTFSDKDFWTRGLTQISRDFDLRGIRKKVIEAEKAKGAALETSDFDRILTPSEKAELMAFYALGYAQANDTIGRAVDLSSAYRAGQSAAESAGYMAEFALGTGVGNLAGKAILKKSTSAFARWMGESLMSTKAQGTAIEKGLLPAVERVGAKQELNAIGRSAGQSLVNGASRTITQPLGTLSNIAQKMNETNDEGELNSVMKGIFLGVTDAFIENWSETFGNTIDGVFGFMGNRIGDLASRYTIKTDFGKMARWAFNSNFTKTLAEGGFNGPIGEILEEWVGNAARVATPLMTGKEFGEWGGYLFSSDPTKRQEAMKSQLEMAASFGPMSIIGFAGQARAARTYAKEYEKLSEQAKQILLKNEVKDAKGEKLTQAGVDALFKQKWATSEDIANTLAPYAAQIKESGSGTAQKDYETMLRFAGKAGIKSFNDAVTELKNEGKRNEVRDAISSTAGKFWQDYESPVNDAEGNPIQIQQVRVIDYADGTRRYVIAGEGIDESGNRIYATIGEDGTRGFVNDAEIKRGLEDGSITGDREMMLKDYLQERVEATEKSDEARRMQVDATQNLKAVQEKVKSLQTINIGTTESPIEATIIPESINAQGVTVALNSDGSYQRQLSWKEAAEYLGMPFGAKTDAQIEEEEADRNREAGVRKDSYNRIPVGTPITLVLDENTTEQHRFAKAIHDENEDFVRIYLTDENGEILKDADGNEQWFPDTMIQGIDQLATQFANGAELKETVEEEKEIQDEAPVAPVAKYTDENGEVNQNAFLEQEPEEWAKWNDARRNDGGKGTIGTINAGLKKLDKDIKKAQKAWEDEANPNERDKKELALGKLVDRRQRLNTILETYKQREAEAQAATAQQPVAETPAQPVADQPVEETPAQPVAEQPVAETPVAPVAEQPQPEQAPAPVAEEPERRGSLAQRVTDILSGKDKTDYRGHFNDKVEYPDDEYYEVVNQWDKFKAGVEAIIQPMQRRVSEIVDSLRNEARQEILDRAASRGETVGGATLENATTDVLEQKLKGNEEYQNLVKEINSLNEQISPQAKDRFRQNAIGMIKQHYQAVKEQKQAEAEAQPTEVEQTPAPAQEATEEAPAEGELTEAQKNVIGMVEGKTPEQVESDYKKRKKEEKRQRKLIERAEKWKGFIGDVFQLLTSMDDIMALDEWTRGQVLDEMKKNTVHAWYNPNNGKVMVYLPNIKDTKMFDQKILHEVISHRGIRGLFKTKAGFGKFLDKVWDEVMKEDARNYFLNYVKGTADSQSARRAATDEFLAHVAEGNTSIIKELDKDSTWNKIIDVLRNIINDMMGEDVLTDRDTWFDDMLKQATDMYRGRAALEEGVSSTTQAARLDKQPLSFSYATEKDVEEKIRHFAKSAEGKKLGWTEEQVESIISETADLMRAIHASLSGDKYYDEWAKRVPTMKVDWRDGVEKPVVTWSRANIEYKYDMSADLLCINNEGLETVLASPTMADLMLAINKSTKEGFSSDDYLRLYETLRDMGFVVPCKGCFDAAMRLKMLPSVARKFVDLVNKTIDERNADPQKFDEEVRARAGENATVGGLPTSAKNKEDAVRIAVIGDNLTEHIKWTDLMSAEGQTQMLSDWGGIFRAWQRTGAGRPKDKLLPEPWSGEIVSTTTTIIGKYGEKTPSYRDINVNQGTGLRRNSHSEFRPILAIDEIQFMREAYLRGLTVFKYMKELDDVRLFGQLGVKFNMSFFPAFVEGAPAAGLDKNGNYIAAEESVGGREFEYTGEDGKKHYDGMRGWEEARKYVNKDVSLSSVVFSIPHLIKSFTDVPTASNPTGLWGSLIPFHSSGATSHSLEVQGLGRARANGVGHGFEEALTDYGEGVTNFEAVQNDRFGEGWEIVEGKKAGTVVEPGHKLEFANGTHYYNKNLGLHLFQSFYIYDNELQPKHLDKNGKIIASKAKTAGHPFAIDYNDKVREIGTDTAYQDAADYYIGELRNIGLIPRFDFEVPEGIFLKMCEDANVDPRHPKLGWRGPGNSWSPVDSPAYYSLWCDYGMIDPATGKLAPHNPVGAIDANGNRVFKLPDNTIDIIKAGVERYSTRKDAETARELEAIEEYAKRSVADGRLSKKDADAIIESAKNNLNGSEAERLFPFMKEARLVREANATQKQPVSEQSGQGTVTEEDTAEAMLFSLSRNNRATVESWLDKREDLSEEQRAEVVKYIDNLPDSKTQLATARWFANGTIRIPEDMKKVNQAISVAEKAKVDPLRYKSPMELLDAHAEFKPTEERINPDEVSTLHRVAEYPEGIVVYDVDNTEESRKNMREIINTHFGKDASPWCLLQGDKEGNLTSDSKRYWRHYNAYPKQVAFKNGKLLAFSANDTHTRLWWDRQDQSHYGIPITKKVEGDELGRSAHYILVPPKFTRQDAAAAESPWWEREEGVDYPQAVPNETDKPAFVREPGTHLFRGNRQNGAYEEWSGDGEFLVERTHYVNGKENGLSEKWYPSGQIWRRAVMKDDQYAGTYEMWYENGQQKMSIGMNEKGEKDGEQIGWWQNGNKQYEARYKDGHYVGDRIDYFDVGEPKSILHYDESGDLTGYEDYAIYRSPGGKSHIGIAKRVAYIGNDTNRRVEETFWATGNVHEKAEFHGTKLDGIQEFYNADGTIHSRTHWVEGERHGIKEVWYDDGKLWIRSNFYHGEPDVNGISELYDKEGNPIYKKEYKDGEVVRDYLAEEKDLRFSKSGLTPAIEDLNTEGVSVNNEELLKEYGLSDATLSKKGNVVTLNKVVAAEKNQGNGTRFMEDLTGIADEKGWTLALTPDDSFGATSVKRLKDFYKRFGFKENKGRNTDFTINESMVRTPFRLQFSKTYHGTGADFDRFDHSHMGEGEGGQMYGWGTYVTTNKDTGLAYARSIGGSDEQYERAVRSIDNQIDSDRTKLEKAKTDEEKKALEDDIALMEQRKREMQRHLYTVEIPDDNGQNYIHWDEPLTRQQSQKIMNAIRERVNADEWGDEFEYELKSALGPGTYGRYVEGGLDYFLGDMKNYSTGEDPGAERNSKLLKSLGIVGMEIPIDRMGGQRYGGSNYVIFDEDDLEITEHLRFSKENANQEVFVSNAAKAVEGIQQEKATPEQWLKMVESKGGLKAGEDKWIGLSDWLKSQDKKSLTKQEVLDYVNENKIKIEEVDYASLSQQQKEASDQIGQILGIPIASEEWLDGHYGLNKNEYGNLELGISGKYRLVKDTWKAIDEKFGRDNYKSEREFKEMLARMVQPQLNTTRRINPTREDYTTPGLENNREIALTVPTIEPWNREDNIHFGDAGEGRAIAWIRFGETATDNYESSESERHEAQNIIHEYDEYRNELKSKYGREFLLPATFEREHPDESAKLDELYNRAEEAKKAFVERKDAPRVLVIDEIQSKRHQEGREKGYKGDPVQEAKVKGLQEEVVETDRAIDRAVELIAQAHNEENYKVWNATAGVFTQRGFVTKATTQKNYKKAVAKYGQGTMDEMEQLVSAHQAAMQDLRTEAWNMKNAIPTAPFEKNWHELAMKRMLRLAAEEGYDYVAWTTGEQQAERYNIGNILDYVARNEDSSEGNRVFELGLTGGEGTIDLETDEEGKIIKSNEIQYNDKNLSDVVGKDMAIKMLTLKEDEDLDGDRLRVGAEGMKGFYDQMLPRFMDKYGKKWGVKTEDISLPNIYDEVGHPLVMHSVRVTPEMKESVMEGQLMFSKSYSAEDANTEGEVLAESLQFSKVTDEDLLDKLNKGKTFKAYRAMAFIEDENGDVEADLGDGRGVRRGFLYSPMATQEKDEEGKWKLRQPTEMNAWEQSDEHPEKAVQGKDGKWYFILKKPDGSEVRAAYNPYIHTSLIPLNDQFTAAHKRPELVTVEVEVPESELTSGYKADKAKDSVGKMSWHAGPVAGLLPEGNKREVVLSRYNRPLRVVPNSEVADKIVEAFNGKEIPALPWNVFTPALREELSKRGVEFSTTPSGTVSEADQKAYEESMRFSKENESGLTKNQMQKRTIDKALAFVTGRPIKEISAERKAVEQEEKVRLGKIFDDILKNGFNELNLPEFNEYVEQATYDSRKRILERLPQAVVRSLRTQQRANQVDAAISRVAESAVPPAERRNREGRKKIDAEKKRLLESWAKASGLWFTNISDIPNIESPERFDYGKESDVYASKEKDYVIKVNKGKSLDKKHPTDIDRFAIFNYLFPETACDIIGYGNFEDGFRTILRQPAIRFTEKGPIKLTKQERIDFMDKLDFEPINDEATAFKGKKQRTNAYIVADLKKGNIVKDAGGVIRVIDADIRLYTKDIGGTYVIPEVEDSYIKFSKSSVVTPEMDAEFAKAEKEGDTETAMRLVREAAKNAGYDIEAYHGGPYRFNVFDRYRLGQTTDADSAREGFFFTDEKELADWFAKQSLSKLPTEETLSHLREQVQQISSENVDNAFESYKDTDWGRFNYSDYEYECEDRGEEPTDEGFLKETGHLKEGMTIGQAKRDFVYDFIEQRLLDGSVMFEDDFEEFNDEMHTLGIDFGHTQHVFIKITNPLIDSNERDYFDEDQQIDEPMTEVIRKAKHEGHDGVIFTNIKENDGSGYATQYVAFDPNQIKSADPFTYDDNGNLIPLSERFNPENEDIRFSLTQEEGESDYDFANRSMRDIAGKYKSVAKGRMIYNAKEDSPAGDYDPETDIVRIFARPNTPYREYEGTFFHENLHAFFRKNGIDGTNPAVSDVIEVSRKADPDGVAEEEEKLRKDENYDEQVKAEELFVRLMEGFMTGGYAPAIIRNVPKDTADLLGKYFNAIGYDAEQESTRRLAERNKGRAGLDEDAQDSNSEVRLRDREEVRDSGGEGGEQRIDEDSALQFSKTNEAVESASKEGIGAVVGEENVGEFYNDIYKAIPRQLRAMVAGRAMENGLNFRNAIADRLSEIARNGYENDESGVLLMAGPILSYYAGISLDPNSVRYILWRGQEGQRPGDILGMAQDIAMRSQLRVGQYAEPLRFSKGELSDSLNAADKVAEETADTAKESLDRNKKDLKDLLTATRAMMLQREYDKNTVEAISNLAKTLMKDQYIDALSRREVARLLGMVRTSVGKSPKTVKKNADALVGMVIDHLLKRERDGLAKLTSKTGSKVNATGVEVQGELDIQGQKILKAYKEGLNHDVGKVDDSEEENTLYGMKARLAERLESKDDAVRKEAEAEDLGLTLAIEYKENVKSLQDDEKGLEDSLKDLAQQLKDGKISRDYYNQNEEAIRDNIRANRIEQVESLRDFRRRMQEMMAGSVEAKKSFVEREKERKEQIHHLANSDMQGRNADTEHDKTKWDKLANSAIVRFFMKPLGTFDQMLRLFGEKHAAGEGYLWNKYVRDWEDATAKAYIGQRDAKAELDAKVSEVFGKDMIWSDLYSEENKMPRATVRWFGADGKYKEHELTQGQLLYIYMVNKMADGRMKLRKMGIMEEDVMAIKRQMDERFLTLADWLQEEYLVEKRNKYNAIHERLFGASMAAIDNYFPLVINKRDLNRNEDIAAADFDTLPSTTTGSIIKRKRNNKALDLLNADAFSVVIDHIDQMEQWAAFAEFNKDINTLLSYKRFRNQVQNMASVYGSGNVLWKNFKDVCRIAGNSYKPSLDKDSLDATAVNIAKGVTAAKISFRVYTALKQTLSMPAFVADTNIGYLAKNIANPMGAWKWAMENLPLFEKRWKSHIAGDTRLMSTDMDWKFFRSKVYDKLSQLGMAPNAFVDAWTVAVGARSMYETRYARYIKDGYSEEEADKRAKQDAVVLYNETQQSNEGAFTSAVQLDRSVLSTAITVFRNSSMGFQRQVHDSIRNLSKLFKKGYKEESIAFMTKQMMRDGLTEEQATRAAERQYNHILTRNGIRLATFGFLVEFAWNLGSSIVYLLFGDDDDEKKAMIVEAARHALLGGTLEGLAGGNVLSDVLNTVAKGESLRNYDPTLLPIISDMKKTIAMFSYDKWAAYNELVNLGIQIGIGANPQTLTDAIVAVVDACNGDLDTSKEAMLLIMRVLQVPQSQLDKIYIDELDSTASDAKKMSYSEMAERYAKYKINKNAPLTAWAYSDEMEKKLDKKYRKRFKDLTKARKELKKK